MNAKNLQKATIMLAEIQKLEKECIEIEKLIHRVLEKEDVSNAEICYSIPDEKKDTKDSGESEYHDLRLPMFTFLGGHYKSDTAEKKQSILINQTEFVVALATILNLKKDKRKMIVGKIAELGVSL